MSKVNPGVHRPFIEFCSSSVVGADNNPRNLRVLPLFMQVGEKEKLRDDTLRCAELAEAADVDLTLERWPDVFHVWHVFGAAIPESAQAIRNISNFIRKHQ